MSGNSEGASARPQADRPPREHAREQLGTAAPSPALTQGGSPLQRIRRRFGPYLQGHRVLLGGSVLALLGTTAMRLLEPWPLAWVIDRVLLGLGAELGWAGAAAQAGLQLDAMGLLALCALGVVAIAGVKAVLSYLSTIGFALVGSRVLSVVRNDLFAHLQRLSLSFHHRARTGDLTMRLINDVGMLKEATVTALLPMAANVLVLAGMFAVMAWLDWRLTLIALLPLPLLWLSTVRRGRRIHEASRRQRQREGAMAATASEAMASIRTVQSLALEDVLAKSFRGADDGSLKQDVQSKRLAAGLERSVDLLVALGTAMVLWQGARAVIAGSLTPGDLLVFLTYLKSSFRPVREYAKYTGRLSKALAAGERIADIFDEEPEIRDRPGARPAPALSGRVRFEGVSFGYGLGQAAVLDGIDFDVQPGEHVAIVGPSGAGKSTLSSLLLRLYDPTAGAIRLDGVDLREYTLRSLRRQISVVPQDSLLFAASVRENIALAALGEVDDGAIEAAARLANAHGFISAMPEGYDTPISERGATLSGGQRQRISVARAALRSSPIVILDEPTAGLDGENERIVTDALLRLLQGRTGFIITHDLHLAAAADRVLYLDHGCVLEQGSHAELLARGGRYAALWRLQAATRAGHSLEGELHAV